MDPKWGTWLGYANLGLRTPLPTHKKPRKQKHEKNVPKKILCLISLDSPLASVPFFKAGKCPENVETALFLHTCIKSAICPEVR